VNQRAGRSRKKQKEAERSRKKQKDGDTLTIGWNKETYIYTTRTHNKKTQKRKKKEGMLNRKTKYSRME